MKVKHLLSLSFLELCKTRAYSDWISINGKQSYTLSMPVLLFGIVMLYCLQTGLKIMGKQNFKNRLFVQPANLDKSVLADLMLISQ